MKQRDALEIFSFTNYYGAHTTTVLLNAANSVKYAVKTASIVEQHKRVETLLERDSIDDLSTAQGRLVHLRDSEVVLFKVYRKFKPPFSRCATVSPPGRQAVNRAVFRENSPLSITIRPLNRPESPHLDAIPPLRASAGRAASSATLSRAVLVLNIRLPEREAAAAPVSAAGLSQASPGA
jgi:hypothetical protein